MHGACTRQPGVLIPDEKVDEDRDHLVRHAQYGVAGGGDLRAAVPPGEGDGQPHDAGGDEVGDGARRPEVVAGAAQRYELVRLVAKERDGQHRCDAQHVGVLRGAPPG